MLARAGDRTGVDTMHMQHGTTITIQDGSNGLSRRTRPALLLLPAFYAAVLAATIIDGIVGGSPVAFWSMLLVLVISFLLMRATRFLCTLDSLTAWLWQMARCTALAAVFAVGIGILVMLFGDGTSSTVSRGLALASFSMLYGVLIALPAGCAVVCLERNE